MSSWIVVVAACREPSGAPPLPPGDRLTLAVTEIAPNEIAGFRVVGGPPRTDVTIVELTRDETLTTETTDASGMFLFEIAMPGDIEVGRDLVYQAWTKDGTNDLASNVVERTIVEQEDYEAPPATNVLVVLIDDVGVDRFGLYGATTTSAHTPHIDALAAEGVVFDNAWAMPWCEPTRAALQTGRFGRRTGYGINPGMHAGIELDPNLITLAELVDYSPWHTTATSYVGKWHLSSFDSATTYWSPLVQGWDWWAGSIVGQISDWDVLVPVPVEPPNVPGYSYWQKFDTTSNAVTASTVYATTDNADDAIERMAAMTEPWLLQVSFNSAHSPYHVPPAHYTTPPAGASWTTAEKARAMLEAVDFEIGRLRAAASGATLDTTIFFLGDNGTPASVLETDVPMGEPAEGKATIFDGGIRVPFVVSGAHVHTTGHSDQLVSVVDVFPTIAEIAGVDTSILPGGSLHPQRPVALDGYSLLPALREVPEPTGRTFLYSEVFTPGGQGPFDDDKRAIRDADHKLVISQCGAERLYEYDPAVDDEGVDLLAGGKTPEQLPSQAHTDAYYALEEQADRLLAAMEDNYDDVVWPASTSEGCP
jgi:arylsulfatase A-like enzyme